MRSHNTRSVLEVRTHGATIGRRKPKVQSISTSLKDSLMTLVTAVLPIYMDLTKESLLSGCLHGRTQNQNEAINQLYWIRCPKCVFVGKDVLELGVYDSVIVFNSGMRACTEVLSQMGLAIGEHCYQAYCNMDSDRIRHAKRSTSEKKKKRRKYLRWKKKGREDWCQDQEGTVYESGAF